MTLGCINNRYEEKSKVTELQHYNTSLQVASRTTDYTIEPILFVLNEGKYEKHIHSDDRR